MTFPWQITETELLVLLVTLLLLSLYWLYRTMRNMGDPVACYGYFELEQPYRGECPCNQSDCPANQGELSIEAGYLNIDQVMVDFRKNTLRLQQLEQKYQHVQEQISENAPVRDYRQILLRLTTPALYCRHGAVQAGLQLQVAAGDAARLATKRQVPLRTTPMVPLEEQIAARPQVREPLPQAILTILEKS